MKMTRRERKAYKLGKLVGYADGYAKGLHDGNPFIAIGEAVSEMAKRISVLMSDPEIIELCKSELKGETNETETYDE